MIEGITKFVENLKSNLRLLTYGEEATKQSIILPLLNLLGWNVFNIEEVSPEFSVENGRVDYSLRLNNTNEVFIEVKKTSEDLDKIQYQEQLLNYSFRHGVELAILTNGLTWWFYLPKEKGDWKARKFYSIDITQQQSADVAKRFVDLISKSNVQLGKALQNAKTLYEEKLKKKIFEKTLPESWNKIISEPESLLLELLAETTEKLCGFKPNIEEVVRFIEQHQSHFTIGSITHQPTIPPLVTRRPTQPFSRSKPEKGQQKMALTNDTFIINKANEILRNTAEWLIKSGKLKATNYPIQLPGSDRYIINNQPVHRNGRPFDNKTHLSNGLWLFTNFSSSHCELYSRRLLEYFGVPSDTLIIE